MTTIGPIAFRGGLNLKSSSIGFPPNQMTDAQNVFISYNDLVKANGSVTVNSAAIDSGLKVDGLFQCRFSSNSNSYLLLTTFTLTFVNNFRYITNLGTTATNITNSAHGSLVASDYAMLNNIVVIASTVLPSKWAGPGNDIVALPGSPPACTICTVANNFMFLSGNDTNTSRVYWSNVGDPETWTATNYVDFRPTDGDQVIDLCSYGQNLLIWKKNSIGQLFTNATSVSGSTTLAPLVEVRVGKGLAARRALDYIDQSNICFVGSDNHIYIYDGATFHDIGDRPYPASNIQPYLDEIDISQASPLVVNYPRRNQVWIAAYDSSLGGTGDRNVILVYNYSLGVWESKITGRSLASMISYISEDSGDGGTYPVTILTGSPNGFVYQQDVGTENAQDTNGNIDGYGTVSVEVVPSAGDFYPVSAVVPVEGAGFWNLEVNYGFNQTNVTEKSTSLSLDVAGGKLDLLVLDVDRLGGGGLVRRRVKFFSNNNVATMQIQFRNRNASEPFTVHPFYISDEVIQ